MDDTKAKATLPGTPRWNGELKRFEEKVDVDARLLTSLKLETVELGYSFFEPHGKRALYLLRGLMPGHDKTIEQDRGTVKAAKKTIHVWCCCLLQDVTGKLYSWDVSAKGAYTQLLRSLDPRSADPNKLQVTLDSMVPLWIHKNDETWTIKLGDAKDREGAEELLATVEA